MSQTARIDPRSTILSQNADRQIAAFASAVVRCDRVDPLLSELVRLRCARVHDCRLCGSLRQRKALDAGLTESLVGRIDTYERAELDPAWVAALRLCDAMILTPGRVPEGLGDELRRFFSDEQIAEIMMDVVKWSQQKALVALRTEQPPWTVTEVLDFDDNGDPLFCGPANLG